MNVHRVEPNIIAKIQSAVTIKSINQCITELVLNSLDAKSTAVAVRVNCVTFRIQVVDNGDGITKDNLKVIGERYMTSKCKNLQRLESRHDCYGFRGETLASIIKLSKQVEITSKCKNSTDTYSKSSGTNNIRIVKERPSYGTTVTVEGFLNNLPLRRQRVIPELELSYIKRNIESLVIIHPNVSFSVRNDITGDLVLNSRKCKDIITSFKSLHPNINCDYSLIKVSKNEVTFKALLFKDMSQSNQLQYIYVNKRPVKCSKIQTFISNVIQKQNAYNTITMAEKTTHPVYVMNIKCPYSFFDIIPSTSSVTVDFHKWDIIFSCVEKLIASFTGVGTDTERKTDKTNRVNTSKPLRKTGVISHINGVYKSYGFKRKSNSKCVEEVRKKTRRHTPTSATALNEDKFTEDVKANTVVEEIEDESTSRVIMNNNPVQKYVPRELPTLPIKICNNMCRFPNKKSVVASKVPELNVYKPPGEESLLSKFTNNETKGKDLIMDMFLKSTQVYNSDDESDKRSDDTVLEFESNYFLQNVTTNINGKNKTMSVSVNITKKIKKTSKVYKRRNTESKSIQTSQNKMIGKCVQTSMYLQQGMDYSVFSRNNLPLPIDCTIVLSTNEAPRWKFVYDTNQGNVINLKAMQLNNVATNHSLKLHDISLSPIRNGTSPNRNEDRIEFNNQDSAICVNSFSCRKSPYFSHRPILRDCSVLDANNVPNNRSSAIAKTHQYFNPQFQSTQKHSVYNKNVPHGSDMFCFNRLTTYNNAEGFKTYSHISDIGNQFNVSSFAKESESSKKSYNHQMSKRFQNCDNITFLFNNKSDCAGEVTLPEKLTDNRISSARNTGIISSDLQEHTKLFITLSNKEKYQILKSEIDNEKQFWYNTDLEWDCTSRQCEEVGLETSHQGWIKKEKFGNNFYINKKTGFATFHTPNKATTDFKLCKRFDFMPKGLSPILKETKKVNISLSQNKKDKLESYILQSHQDELLLVKWHNYIKTEDPKTFFEEVYKERINSLEDSIPKATHCKKYLSKLSTPIVFNKTLFDNITVIGQVDTKFIAVVERTKRLIILFDQHAVHERVRLEQLVNAYTNPIIQSCGYKTMVFLSHTDVSLLEKHEKYLNYLGLRVEFFDDGLNVVGIPSCLHTKFKDKDDSSLNTLVQLLIKEVIDVIKETEGVTFRNIPKIIQNTINLEACRGAIKFGDTLTYADCDRLLRDLSACNLPFQCAHGRPTLVPLITLNSTCETVTEALQFKNLQLQ